MCCFLRDRPAAVPVQIKSIDDTSNFDEFPEGDFKWREYCLYYKYITYFMTKDQIKRAGNRVCASTSSTKETCDVALKDIKLHNGFRKGLTVFLTSLVIRYACLLEGSIPVLINHVNKI